MAIKPLRRQGDLSPPPSDIALVPISAQEAERNRIWMYRLSLKSDAVWAKYVRKGLFDDTSDALVMALRTSLQFTNPGPAQLNAELGRLFRGVCRIHDRHHPRRPTFLLRSLATPTGLHRFCLTLLVDLRRIHEGMKRHHALGLRSIDIGHFMGPVESPLPRSNNTELVHAVWDYLRKIAGPSRPETPVSCRTAMEAISALERAIAWLEVNGAQLRKVRIRCGRKKKYADEYLLEVKEAVKLSSHKDAASRFGVSTNEIRKALSALRSRNRKAK